MIRLSLLHDERWPRNTGSPCERQRLFQPESALIQRPSSESSTKPPNSGEAGILTFAPKTGHTDRNWKGDKDMDNGTVADADTEVEALKRRFQKTQSGGASFNVVSDVSGHKFDLA